jgi:SAM-dependent methyltransferase
VVDIGCGHSPYRPLLTAATRYTGIETETRYRPSLIAFADALPFPDESVDSIMLTEVLEHVREPSEALAEARRVLKPGGQLYVTVPMTWGLHYVPHDYYRFTSYGISHLLEKTGFEIEAIEPMGGLFSIISARLAEVFTVLFLDRPLKALGMEKGRLRACAVALAGCNFISYYMSRFLDRFWKQDVFGWAVLARRP